MSHAHADADVVSDASTAPANRIGRPPKLDEHGTPTRERLLRAAIDACVEYGYEGVTLSEIARRADVSTPAVYSHFAGKAALLVEASQHELRKLSPARLPRAAGMREIARHWLRPDFADTRVLLAELHCAAIRQPEVADLLRNWQRDNAEGLRALGLTLTQIKVFYLLLIGATHLDEVSGLEVDQPEMEAEMTDLIDRWIGERPADEPA